MDSLAIRGFLLGVAIFPKKIGQEFLKNSAAFTAGSRSEAPKKANQEAECTQEVSDQTSKSTDTHSENPEAVDTCSRDNTQKVHDHRKAKNLP